MKIKLILWSFIFFTISCSKADGTKEDGLVEGTILEEHYDTPIKGVKAFLTSVLKSGGKQQFEAEGFSDDHGHYTVNFNYSANKHYQVQFYSTAIGNNIFTISSKKTNINLVQPTISNLKLKLKNNRTNAIQLSISGKESPSLHTYIVDCSLKAKADSLIPFSINVNGFGKTALSYSIISAQSPLQIVNDTISIFTKTDTLIHLIEIN